MCCKNFWKRIIPFAIALAISLLAVNILRTRPVPNQFSEELKPIIKTVRSEEGRGRSGICLPESQQRREFADKYYEDFYRENNSKNTKSENQYTKNLQIISKVQPEYPDSARMNNVQGSVSLRVEFLANGQIGNISTINGLPEGLTEECISAAKQIKFEPARRNGNPVTVSKVVQYSFTIY